MVNFAMLVCQRVNLVIFTEHDTNDFDLRPGVEYGREKAVIGSINCTDGPSAHFFSCFLFFLSLNSTSD